jgi:hypothetical protein
MAIIKTLACSVLFLAQVTNADFYVNCMAAPDATPDDGCTSDVLPEVLNMLQSCTDLDMSYVGQARRHLRSRQQTRQSKRELQDPDNGCYETNLSGGARMMCCMQTNDKYSYCGSPTSDRRELQAVGSYSETELSTIAAGCTAAFKILANETETACYGSAEDVFCETIQVLMG